MLYSIVGILVVILDQAVKFWVQNTLFGTDIVKFIPGVVSLVNVQNTGAAFGILSGSNARIYFIIVTGIFCLLVVLALATNFVTGRLARWSLVMVAAGGIGNMIDRILYGYVQDMFKVELFNFAIFNVADIFITVFAILFALCMIFEKPEEDIDDELYEDDIEEDEEDEDDVPARKPLFGKLKEKRQAARSASKKSRQEKYEREYEEYRAQQLEAMNMDPRPRKTAAPAADAENAKAVRRVQQAQQAPQSAPQRRSAQPAEQPRRKSHSEDPFAAWEKASAKHDNARQASLAEKAMGTSAPRPVQKPQRPVVQAPVEEAPAAPAREAAAAKTLEQPVQAQPKPQSKAVADDDFNLDDILAEFK